MNPPAPSRPAGPPAASPRRSWLAFAILAGLLAGFWLLQRSDGRSGSSIDVAYSVAYSWIRDGKVASVTLEGSSLDGQLAEPQTADGHELERFRTVIPDDDTLVPLLHEKRVRIQVRSPAEPVLIQVLTSLLPWALIIGLWVWISRRARTSMGGALGPMGGFLKKGHRFERATSVEVKFDQVAGLGSAKRDLQEIVQFLVEPERFRRLGGKIPRGVLLIGPPGTGKTLLARAVAGEAEVPFYSMSGSEFIEMFVGVGAARVRELFQEAKKNAPSIVFIDEIDAVGRVRGAGLGGGHDEREQTLNQLLSEMDGFDRTDLTVVLAATNRPDILDPALLRPGRFDRRVVVDLPETSARRDILAVHCKGKPLADDVELQALADGTPGFSGADLANLVNEAALHATRRRADQIERRDFTAAHDKIVLGDPREGRLTPAEKKRVALHEAGHAVAAWASPHAEPLRRVSILPRGMALGATQQAAPEDRHLLTRAELDARLLVLLGGYAAERSVLGDVSSGSERDLREATSVAARMVSHYGMSEELGPIYHEYQEAHAFLGHRIATEGGTSDATIHAIEREAQRLLGLALAGAIELLERHRPELDRMAAALLERETLEREDIEALVGPRPPANATSAPGRSALARAHRMHRIAPGQRVEEGV